MNKENPYISQLKDINLLNGLFLGDISFENGLNIIGGENGTGKTKLLQSIKVGTKEFANSATNRIVIFNPKRNAEKQSLEHFVNKLKTQGINSEKLNKTLNQQNIDDSHFSSYPSFGELFILSYEAITEKDDGSISKKNAIELVNNEFNSVLGRVFPSYKVISSWVDGKLQIEIEKNKDNKYSVAGLSCGESEVLSLIFNIYANRERQDIYLIDEPEIHLNWSLEEGLFNFFDWFCEEYNKQIIVVTHSRMIFQDKFFKKSQFLVWSEGKIIIDNKISKEIRDKIAGDSIKLISSLELNKQTFFVEDNAQVKVIEELSKTTGKDLRVIALGDCSAVKSFCKVAQKEGIQNACFLVDGDNQNPPQDLKDNLSYIHLKKYCIQNYLLDAGIIAEIANPKINEAQAKQKIRDSIMSANSDSRILVFQKMAEMMDIPSEILDTFDASKIIDKLVINIGLSSPEEMIEKFINTAQERREIESIFKEIISRMN